MEKKKILGPIALLKEIRGTVRIVTWPTATEVVKRFITVALVSVISAGIIIAFDLGVGRLFTLIM